MDEVESYYEEYHVDGNNERDRGPRLRGPFLGDRLAPPGVILGLDEARDATIGLRTVVASGGFDPLHPGHVGYLRGAAELARRNHALLVVIVNGDGFLTRKKGRPFMSLRDRCEVVAGLTGVDTVVPFEDEGQTVDRALKALRPLCFVKGGDRTGPENIPEWGTCQELGIKVVTDVGPEKRWSSSELVAESVRAPYERAFAASPSELATVAVTSAALRLGTCPNCHQYDPGGRHWDDLDGPNRAGYACPTPGIKFRRGETDARAGHPASELTPEYMAGYRRGRE